jgi:hypothetical protein
MCSSRFAPAARQALTTACGSLDVRALEVAVQDADQVDHRLLAGGEPRQHARREHVGLDHVDRRQQDEVLGALAASRGHR